MTRNIKISALSHTWVLDLDGTILEHNGHLRGGDILLPGVLDFFSKIPKLDMILILTAREHKYEKKTKKFLIDNNIRFDYLIFNVPTGERLLFNDAKPSGLKTAHAINLTRNLGMENLEILINNNL